MRPPTPIPLDSKFWARFAKSTWEKKSVCFRNVSTPLLEIDAAGIFSLLVELSGRCRKLKDAAGFKFYIEGHRQFDSEVLRHLPTKSDRSLEGYHSRMNEMYSDYCLVCDELLQVNHARQTALIDFTSGLFEHVGFPNRFVEMGLYLGNYRKTPFGVHVDGCGVFSFPVGGKKKFRIWKPDYVAKHPKLARAFSYAKHKAASQVLTAQPGDMTYWPSSAWHVAESDGRFSATWSLGVWVDQSFSESVSEIAAGLATDLVVRHLGLSKANSGMTPYVSLHVRSGEVQKLPEIYQESVDALIQIPPGEIQTAFLVSWMKLTSKQGFKTIASRPIKLKSDSMLRLRYPQSPVRWVRTHIADKIVYGFDGKLTNALTSKALHQLIEKINQGKIGSIKKDFREKGEGLRALQLLADAGAFISVN